MTRPLFLVDCDDTLFVSARKIKDVDLSECTVASTLEDGTPSGYRTPKLNDLKDLLALGDVVPVTARSRAVLSRCDVPQAPAICSNGGMLVDADGRPNAQWEEVIGNHVGNGDEIAMVHDQMAILSQEVTTRGPSAFRHWIVKEGGRPLYVVFKSNASDEDEVARLANTADAGALPTGWRIHRNGNNLAAMPPWLSKRAAVRHLIERVRSESPHRLVVGLGDSVSDLGFMAECDFAMHPVQSQIGNLVAQGHDW